MFREIPEYSRFVATLDMIRFSCALEQFSLPHRQNQTKFKNIDELEKSDKQSTDP